VDLLKISSCKSKRSQFPERFTVAVSLVTHWRKVNFVLTTVDDLYGSTTNRWCLGMFHEELPPYSKPVVANGAWRMDSAASAVAAASVVTSSRCHTWRIIRHVWQRLEISTDAAWISVRCVHTVRFYDAVAVKPLYIQLLFTVCTLCKFKCGYSKHRKLYIDLYFTINGSTKLRRYKNSQLQKCTKTHVKSRRIAYKTSKNRLRLGGAWRIL